MKKEGHAGGIIPQPVAPIHLWIHAHTGNRLIARVREEFNERYYRETVASKLVSGLRANRALTGLGDRLLAMIEHGFAHRRLDIVERISLLMLSLPLEINHHSGALYYYALCRKRQGNRDVAKALFERLADEATLRFRAKSFSSLAALAMDEGDYRSSLELYYEYLDITTRDDKSTLADLVQAHRSLAVMKSIDGDHRGSLSYLEKLMPLALTVRPAHPHTYYDLLNSLAVELSETGRMEEAQNASAVALASAFAPAYPEWHETREEIAEKAARGFRLRAPAASTTSKPVNIVQFPASGQSPAFNPGEQQREKRGRILSFQVWKKTAGKKISTPSAGGPTRRRIEKMSLPEKQVTLMRLIFQEDVNEETLTRLLTVIEELYGKNRPD